MKIGLEEVLNYIKNNFNYDISTLNSELLFNDDRGYVSYDFDFKISKDEIVFLLDVFSNTIDITYEFDCKHSLFIQLFKRHQVEGELLNKFFAAELREEKIKELTK
jgi:hypothetical protein